MLKMHSLLNKSQVKVVLEIFRNPGINVREIISKTKLSPNYILKFVNSLVERGILREERMEKKRVYLRRFFINFKSGSARNFFKLLKEEEKELFLEKYSELKPVFEQLEKRVNADFVLVYGSYARLQATKESDIDVLVVGNKVNKEVVKEIFVSLDIDASIKVESFKDFNRRKKDALHQQIFKEGVVIFDGGRYFEALSEEERVR